MKRLLIFILWCSPPAASAEPAVVAVLTSETGPYREALSGLREEMGDSLAAFNLSEGQPEIPDSARVIVAFGAKAALRDYGDQSVLIYAMAPGTVIKTQSAVQVHMVPRASVLAGNLKKIYPGIKRLGILWQSPGFAEYIDALREAAGPFGIKIEGAAVKGSSDVPDELRRLYGEIDAIWLPPDPLLLNSISLPVFLEFSRSSKTPLFVPTGGLVERGATASVGPTFREMGRLAGIAARKALKDHAQEGKVYATTVEIVINKTAAAEVGLQIPEKTIREVDKVLP